jgi:DNA-binding response OmpR family regulator
VIPGRGSDRTHDATPSVLVVDDDRRVLELLDIAYGAHGFKVWTAADGEEAMNKAIAERPDLLVMDVRLPKKSGLEVCEMIRRDPEHFHIPIILVSAASETESRLQGLQAGADDYLTKPFSPKELIARSRRLLARSAEGRDARRQARDLERELTRVQDEVRRSHLETRREQRMRELAFGLGRELHRTLDVDDLTRRLLLETQGRLGVGAVALLLPGSEGAFTAHAVRGDGFERFAALSIERAGALATMVRALGRPVHQRELERLPELRGEMPPLIGCGCALIAPLATPEGLEALLIADERIDGMELNRNDLELLAGLCEIAAAALATALCFASQLDRQLELLAISHADASTTFRLEAALVVHRAARATMLPPRVLGLVRHAAAFGRGVTAGALRVALERIATTESTGRAGELIRLCEGAELGEDGPGDLPELQRAGGLVAAAWALAERRSRGAGFEEAMDLALEGVASRLDPATVQALRAAAREAAWLEGSAA